MEWKIKGCQKIEWQSKRERERETDDRKEGVQMDVWGC